MRIYVELIAERIVVFPVTGKVALAVVSSHINKFQLAPGRVGDHACLEIDQVGVVGNGTLGYTDPVRIVTGVAGSPHTLLKVKAVLLE